MSDYEMPEFPDFDDVMPVFEGVDIENLEAVEEDSLSNQQIMRDNYSEEERMVHINPQDVPWYEQVTIRANYITVEGFYRGRRYYKVSMPNHFTFPFIEVEGVDKAIIRRYRLEQDTGLDHIVADLRVFQPTVAWKNSDNDAVAVTFYDINGEGVEYTRPWGELQNFTINMLNVGKLFKRVPTLNVRSYLSGEFQVIMIPEGGDDSEYKNRDHSKTVTVQVRDTPTDLFGEKSVDGSAFIRRGMRNVLIDKMYERITSGAYPDIEKAQRLRKMYRKGYVFDTFRGIFGQGLMKAKALVGDDDKLPADIVIYDCNIKPEVFRNDGWITLTMNYKGQGKSVRTNRQIFSLFGEWIYGRDLNLIVDAYNRYVDKTIERFEQGVMVPTSDDKGTYTLNDMANRWIKARGNYNESQYLLNMMRDAHIATQTPEKDDERRMPVPFAKSYSIRTQWEIEVLTGAKVDMDATEIAITQWGFVLGDDIMIDVLEILGGADLDDTAELHFRVAATDSALFHVKQGDVVAVVIRNPVGVSSNGVEVGIEYWVAPVNGAMADMGNLPQIDLRKGSRPLTIPELNIQTPPTLVDNSPNTTHHTEYSKHFVMEAWEKAVEVSPNMVYGRHVNLMMIAKKYDIPFPFVAFEETFADICQQTQGPDELAQIQVDNDEKADYLVREINRRGIAIDPLDVERLKFWDVLNIEPGLTSFFVEQHKAGVERFTEAANEHIAIQFELNRVDDVDVIIVPEGYDAGGRGYRIAPAVLSELLKAERLHGRETGFPWIPQHVRNSIGERVFEEVVVKYGEFLPEYAYNALMAALYKRDRVFDGYERQGLVERGLYYGPMFDVLLDGFQLMKPLED